MCLYKSVYIHGVQSFIEDWVKAVLELIKSLSENVCNGVRIQVDHYFGFIIDNETIDK